jgi:hypothetical protein
LSYHRAKKAAPLRGAAPVTVCTNHLALCHLVENGLPCPVSKARPNAKGFVSEVIELKHDRIVLSAIDTWMLAQISDQKLEAFRHDRFSPATGRGDVSPPVRRVVSLLVCGPAWAAIVVALAFGLAAPGEIFYRLLLPATSATPHCL